MLNEDVIKYNELKQQYDAIDAQMKSLRLQILDEMKAKNLTSVDTDVVTLTIKSSEYITYNDGAIEVLRKIAPQCIKESVDTSMVKACIKSGAITDEIDKFKKSEIRKSITLKSK